MSFTRREFVVGAAAAATSVLLRSSARASTVPATAIIGAFQTVNRITNKPAYSLSVVDHEGRLIRSIALDFHGHGLALDPRNPARAALFQKKGTGACELDLVAGRRLRVIETTVDRQFYGHGVFSADGKRLFATETVLATQQGLIVVRDAQTLSIIGELPSFGAAPHDVQLVDDGRVLAITNGGGRVDGTAPNVALVSAASGHLLETIPIPSGRINAGHLAYTRAHDLVVVSAPRFGLPTTDLGGITVRPHRKPPHTLTEPAPTIGRLVGETLSVAVHEGSRVVATTTPDAGLLTFWTLDGKPLGQVELFMPRGVVVTRDQRHFAVSHGKGAELAFFSTATLKPAAELAVPGAQMSGSHLFLWDQVL